MHSAQPQTHPLAPTLWQISAIIAMFVIVVIAIMTLLNSQAAQMNPDQRAIATHVASWQPGAQ